MKTICLWLGKELSFHLVMLSMLAVIGGAFYFGMRTLIDIREYWP